MLFGTGRAGELLPTVLAELRVRRAMVIGSRGELERSGRVLGGIRPALVFDDAVPRVPVELAERAMPAALGTGADALVAIGGGSEIGLAKAITLSAGPAPTHLPAPAGPRAGPLAYSGGRPAR